MNIPRIIPLRKGQLLMNFLEWLVYHKKYRATIGTERLFADVFYMTDDKLEEYFEEYLRYVQNNLILK